MKKFFLMAVAAALMCGCENDAYMDDVSGNKTITFALNGDWQGSDDAFITRGTVAGSSMTDCWALDYIGGTLQQTIHQTSGDADFGAPTLSLSYGEHTLYFVASQGDTPTLNTTNHTLAFDKVKDTFWKSVNVNVTSGTAANQSVTMDRVVTKLIVKPTDQVPMTLKTVDIQLSTWYNSIDYLTGQPATASTNLLRSVAVTDNYHGTTDVIYFIVQGFCGTTDFTTNVSVTAKDADSNTIGFASIANAPMKRNRTSRFTGTLFGNSNGLTMNINDEWLTDYEGTW